MTAATLIALSALAAVILLPLAREYMDFRREWGFTRLGALATTLLIVPSFAVGLGAAAPLEEAAASWTATVVVTFACYSLAASAVRGASASEAPRRSS